MILHLGSDCFVTAKDILMVLDYREAAKNSDTGRFLAGIQKSYICDEAKCKSIAITEKDGALTAYISPISSGTLLKRSRDKNWYAAVSANTNNNIGETYATRTIR